MIPKVAATISITPMTAITAIVIPTDKEQLLKDTLASFQMCNLTCGA